MHDSVAVLLLTSLLLVPAMARAQPAVKIEKAAYKGWPNCYRMTNGLVELILTSDVGPRVIRFGFVGGDNEFKEYAEQLGKGGEKQWSIRGGHRIWIAPESQKSTYALDNSPIEVRTDNNRLYAIQPVDSAGVQKEMEIRMAAGAPRVEILHRIRNKNKSALEFAPWVLTVLAPGGRAIIPMPPRGPHPQVLEPTHPLVLWAYTDFRDKRWTLGFKYISLQQDPKAKSPQKAGALVPDGWGAYARSGNLFIKKFGVTKNAVYPDFGSSIETFTNADMLELETLGPLTKVAPGAAVEHTERWWLYKGVSLATADDEAIDRAVLPRVRESK